MEKGMVWMDVTAEKGKLGGINETFDETCAVKDRWKGCTRDLRCASSALHTYVIYVMYQV